MKQTHSKTQALYCPTYNNSPFSTYYNLVESSTTLNPNRKPYVTLRTVNQAAKTQWERQGKQMKQDVQRILKDRKL